MGTDNSFRRTLLLPILLLCVFLGYSINFFFSTLLLNVASTFNVPIGTASQLVTIGTLTGLIMGFAMSALAIRFKHKSLFLFGIAFYAVGVLVYFFAPNFATAILAMVLIGASLSTIVIMVYTLIGEQLPLERRGWAAGIVMSSIMASAVVLGTVSGFIASIAGWRMVLLGFIFPISMVCLALAAVVVPSKQPLLQTDVKPSYVQALKKIFMNKSPLACAVSTTLVAFSTVFPIYAVTFLRIIFSASAALGGVYFAIAAGVGIVGGVVGGRLINRYGRKPLTIVAVLFLAISAILFTFMPTAGVSVAIWAINSFAAAVALAGLPSLTLEQVPEYRASMMSINNAFYNAGSVLGVIIGGLVLNLYANNFHILYVLFGVAGAFTAVVLFFFAKDPCKTGSAT
jgi:predicted MFS family arabinose efflux permease